MPPKCQPPDSYNLPGSSRNTPLQGEQIRDQNIGADQVLNDVDMDGYNVTDTNQEDEIHRLIHDTFSSMDEDDNHDDSDHDIDVDPLIKKSQQPLYEGSTSNLLSAILLLVNFKVLNGLSNTSFTQMLRYVIC